MMNTQNMLTISVLSVLFGLGLSGVAPAQGATILIDFGNDSSYRGVSTPSPDGNGNYWNSVWSGAYYPNLTDINGTATAIDLGFVSATGTDFYNGPSGDTQNTAAVDIDAVALGNLGVNEAVYDYYVSSSFEIEGLDPTKTYNLTFFGSHKFSTDDATVYEVYTDNTYTSLVDSASLLVQQSGSPWLHNRDTVATLNGLSPQAGNTLYIKFLGSGGDNGYLNCLQIEENSGVMATSPDPIDGTRFVSLGTNLKWTKPTDYTPTKSVLSFRANDPNWLDTPNTTVINPVVNLDLDGDSATIEAAVPVTLEHETTYYWKVTSFQPNSPAPFEHEGPDWSFTTTTGPPSAFVRSDGLQRGAFRMPYIRYEADQSELGAGATIKGPSYDQLKIESEASERKYVELSQPDSFVQWTINHRVEGVTLRFTMPDSSDGTGLDGSLQLYVNGTFIQNIELTSYFAWQYFDTVPPTDGEPSNDPSVGAPRMRFDEVRFILPQKLNVGDVIKLKRPTNDSITYGIDFIELEAIDPIIEKPAGFIDVTEAPFNATPDDETDDHSAFQNAVQYAYSENTGLYIPPGKFILGGRLRLDDGGLRVLGAGVWHTELHFTSVGNSNGGIYSNGSGNHVSDMYVTSMTHARGGGYRAFGQDWGTGSTIENVWMTHFSVGLWLGDYEFPYTSVTDGLTVRNCRIRNTYADGCNFAKGSRNCILEHCNVRNTVDDACATWASNVSGGVGPTSYNTFRFNTIEHTARAAGVGIFGGEKHMAHHCIIRDSFSGAGIRLNSTFEAYPFATDSYIRIFEMTIERCGTRYSVWQNKIGAIDLAILRFDVNNIKFNNVEVYDSQADGLFIQDQNSGDDSQSIHDVYFDDALVHNVGVDGNQDGYGIFALNDMQGWIQNTNVNMTGSMTAPIYEPASAFQINTTDVSGNQHPVANAGADLLQSQMSSSVQLDGTASYDPEGQPLSYEWVQVDGEPLTIMNPTSATPTVTGLEQGKKYIFRLNINDGVLNDANAVKIGLETDLNSDAITNIQDFSILSQYWNGSLIFGDINEDGTVDLSDVGLLVTDWLELSIE